ncbi:TPA: HtdA [Klebsiella pneumoniae]|nr:HtdA [Klebsiella pneumoniae]HBR1478636.1 HtdA [Klebsiella pneumoniae]
MKYGMIYHGVRKHELLNIIERSGLNFEEAPNTFGFTESLRNPLSLILEGYFIQIIPMAREEHNWEIAPVDTVVLSIIIPPSLDDAPDESTIKVISEYGIGKFELEYAVTKINRMITFVGGVTAENFLHQLRLVYITACQTYDGFDEIEEN